MSRPSVAPLLRSGLRTTVRTAVHLFRGLPASVHHYEGSPPPGAQLNARLVDQSGERWVGDRASCYF